MTGIGLLAIFILAVFVGFEVVSKVSSTLHTPLMSGANAIHGVIVVGAILITARSHGFTALALGFIAIVLATINAVGGFVVTDRMLEMFKSKNTRGNTKADAAKADPKSGAKPGAQTGAKPLTTTATKSGTKGATKADAKGGTKEELETKA